MDPLLAPKGAVSWQENLFWFFAIACCCATMVKVIRGKPASPPNEMLDAANEELVRRLDHLENENKQVWEKMERDRVEAKDRMAVIESRLAAIIATAESISTAINLLNINLLNRLK